MAEAEVVAGVAYQVGRTVCAPVVSALPGG
jgi:hypothetical protein